MKLFWFFQSGSKSSQNRAGVSDPLEIAGLRIIVWMAFLVLLVFGAWASWAKLEQDPNHSISGWRDH